MVSPSAFAVGRLITRSLASGCSTRGRPAWRRSGSSACRDEPSGDGEFWAIVIRVFPEFEELRVPRQSRRRVAEGLRGARDPVDRHRPAWSTLQSLSEVLRGLGGPFQLQEDRPIELVRRNDRIRRGGGGLNCGFVLVRVFFHIEETRLLPRGGGAPTPQLFCPVRDWCVPNGGVVRVALR